MQTNSQSNQIKPVHAPVSASTDATRRVRWGRCAVTALLLTSPHALAQDATTADSRAAVRVTADSGRPSAVSRAQQDDAHGGRAGRSEPRSRSVAIRTENGRISAVIDGVELPPERIVVRDGVVVLLDDQGQPIDDIRIGAPELNRAGDLRNAALLDRIRVRAEAGAVDGIWVGEGPPRAMLGVQMSEPDEALRSHLHLEPGSATIVTRVMDGLAAAQGGMLVHDVIVSIDGKRPAPPDVLREAIAAAEPQTALVLGLIRAGRPLEVRVTLSEFDGRRFHQLPRDFEFGGAIRGAAPELHADVLRDVDQLLRERLVIALPEGAWQNQPRPQPHDEPKAEPRPGAEGRAGAGPARGRELVFRSIEATQRGDGSATRTDERLRAIEARLDMLNERLEKLLERMPGAAAPD